jgi:hypothetical protein
MDTLTGDLKFQNLSLSMNLNLLAQVTPSNRLRYVGDTSHLLCEILSHYVNVVGEFRPFSVDILDTSLSAKYAICADFTSDLANFECESV